MSRSPKDNDTLKRALNFDWPEIQKHLYEEARKKHDYQVDSDGREFYIDDNGKKVYDLNLDSWWLDRFDRKDVISELPGIVVMNTADWHTDSASFTLRDAYGVRRYDDCDDCFSAQDLLSHVERFPQGQFVAIRISGPGAGHAVAYGRHDARFATTDSANPALAPSHRRYAAGRS